MSYSEWAFKWTHNIPRGNEPIFSFGTVQWPPLTWYIGMVHSGPPWYDVLTSFMDTSCVTSSAFTQNIKQWPRPLLTRHTLSLQRLQETWWSTTYRVFSAVLLHTTKSLMGTSLCLLSPKCNLTFKRSSHSGKRLSHVQKLPAHSSFQFSFLSSHWGDGERRVWDWLVD